MCHTLMLFCICISLYECVVCASAQGRIWFINLNVHSGLCYARVWSFRKSNELFLRRIF